METYAALFYSDAERGFLLPPLAWERSPGTNPILVDEGLNSGGTVQDRAWRSPLPSCWISRGHVQWSSTCHRHSMERSCQTWARPSCRTPDRTGTSRKS